MKKLRMLLLWSLAVLSFNVLVIGPSLTIYWLNQSPPISYSFRHVLTPEVPPGGILRIQIASEIWDECEATINRSIIDSAGVKTDFAPTARRRESNFVIELTIPLGASAGPARYVASSDWRCNPIQRIFPKRMLLQPLDFIIKPFAEQEQGLRKQGVWMKPSIFQ